MRILIFLLISSLLFSTIAFGQNATLATNASSQNNMAAKPKATARVKANTIDSNKRYLVRKVFLKNFAKPSIQIRSKKISTISNPKNFKISEKDFEVKDVKLGMEQKKAFALVYIPHYIKTGGTYKVLNDFDLDVQESAPLQNKTAGNRVYASNSVLANGTWKKVSISKPGLYKMDYNYFKNVLGINPDNIDPRKISVHGNGGEKLPEDNAIFRYDDVPENVIEVVGESDGSFDPGDYVLFYANGPHSIIPDYANKRFTHQNNPYNDASYYFITVGANNGKRVAYNAITNPSTQNTSTGNFFLFVDPDSVNLGKSGQNWWSTEFSDLPGRSLSRTYSFSTPNVVASSPLEIHTRVGAITSSGTSVFNVSSNGQNLHTIPLSAIEFNYLDPVTNAQLAITTFTHSASTLPITLNFVQGNSSASGNLDYIEINGRRELTMNGYLRFADWNTQSAGSVTSYTVNGTNTNTKIWDITQAVEVKGISATSQGGGQTVFKQLSDSLHTFIVFDGTQTEIPNFIGNLSNQNLHAEGAKDYLIITHPSFKAQANRLANHHSNKRGYRSLVVTPEEIYNEFSSGSQDVSALRDFIKMFYDKASLTTDIPTGVLFFGDASYDFKNRINGNTNFVPSYQTINSISKIAGYCTDDFFSFLDDIENINDYSIANTCDLGIGRIPCNNATDAKNVVDKILYYDSEKSFGAWKNIMLFNADDEDGNAHFIDAENMSAYISDSLPQYNLYKNYIDAFEQQSTPAGPRTPDAQINFQNRLFNGTFVVNYNGHGGPLGWCEERILTIDDISSLSNLDKLPLFITATCDFTQFDNPALTSAGELLLTNPTGGAIALMTTTRLVFVPGNGIMNINYFKAGFDKINGRYPTLGDAYRDSKNIEYSSSLGAFDADNFRKFALIGDPGLPLAFPKYQIVTDSINGVSVATYTDTLKALGKYTISGHINDENGAILNNFNGLVYPTVIDKPKQLTTLGNDPGSLIRNFDVQNNILFNGKVSAENGRFSFTFVVPKDINYNVGEGKISYYGNTTSEDATGYSLPLIGSSSDNPITDNQGPIIKPFLNDRKFVNGGITTTNSTLIVDLEDDNGINYTGNSVGHDITAILDENTQNTFVLNTFFESALDDYTKGTVRFPVNDLAEGQHTLTIKAWDVFNNSSEAKLDFIVVNNTEGKLDHVYNYPNPFSTKTQFMFEHNMPNQNLNVNLKIFSISGSVVKNIRETINTTGTRYDQIYWDGKDQFGDKLGNGVYLYKLSVKGQNGFSDEKIQKLIILR